MNRAISIHVGVNNPQTKVPVSPLRHSEETAWRMAELAHRAGYHSVLTLLGREATRHAVDGALAAAARTLEAGDILFLSFSGHGGQVRDTSGDERSGLDEALCLHDGILLDDKLAGFWQLFAAGVRILAVVESCHSGGVMRDWDEVVAPPRSQRQRVMRGGEPVVAWEASCIAAAPCDSYGIQASLLLLAASCPKESSGDGVYSGHLFDVWNDGAFRGSYCELHAELRDRTMNGRNTQHPQIMMLGAPDPHFPLSTAFHLGGHSPGQPVTRGGMRGWR